MILKFKTTKQDILREVLQVSFIFYFYVPILLLRHIDNLKSNSVWLDVSVLLFHGYVGRGY